MNPMQLVEAEIRRRGSNLAHLAQKLGVRSQDLNNWKKRGIPRTKQKLIADDLGWSVDYLLYGADQATQISTSATTAAVDIAPQGSRVVAWETLEDLPENGYVQVPHYDVELSAGDGTQWVEHADNSPLVFRAQWFAGKGLKPEHCRALYVSGDSMQPELKDGDTVLIDTSSTTIRDDAVYALVYFDKLYIKRLFLLPGGGVELRSDNKHHPSREVHGADLAQLRILGEKVWRAG